MITVDCQEWQTKWQQKEWQIFSTLVLVSNQQLTSETKWQTEVMPLLLPLLQPVDLEEEIRVAKWQIFLYQYTICVTATLKRQPRKIWLA